MKRFLAISFVFVYLFSGTQAHQLLKIPELINHFKEHKTLESTLSFWKFISLHYAQSHGADADHEKNHKLPFKSHGGCSNLIEVASLPNIHTLTSKPNLCETKAYSHFIEHFLTAAYLAGIWQPPKAC